MMLSMRQLVRYVTVMAVSLPLPFVAVQGQGWLRLPNGELGYQTDYTSTGFFQCNKYFLTKGACHVNGSSVTLSNGGNSFTLTYHGVTTSVVATNQSHRTPMGYIEKSYVGSGPFLFPKTASPNAYYVSFGITVQTLGAGASAGHWAGGYTMHNNALHPINCCDGAATSFTLPVPPPPPPATYSGLAFYSFSNPAVTVDNDPIYLSAGVSITPEPSTIVLLGSGLVGTVGALRRRRRKSPCAAGEGAERGDGLS